MESLRSEVRRAVEAARDKKALNIVVLDLHGLGAFAESFVLCSATSGPHMQAIADEVERELDQIGLRPAHREGNARSEWMLLDYGGLVLHMFLERARAFYDLERLWRNARRLDVPDFDAPPQAMESSG